MDTKVVEDEWRGDSSHDTEYTTSEPLRVASSIIKLDGRVKTAIVLGRGENVFCVGGGNEGRYIAFFACYPLNQLFNLVNANAETSGPMVTVIAGGQGSLFPHSACLDRPSVIQAATHFVMTGEMAPTLSWERG